MISVTARGKQEAKTTCIARVEYCKIIFIDTFDAVEGGSLVLWNEVLDILFVCIDGDQLVSRRIQVGLYVKQRAVVRNPAYEIRRQQLRRNQDEHMELGLEFVLDLVPFDVGPDLVLLHFRNPQKIFLQ